MTTKPFGIDPDSLDDEDFVGNQLANSALVGQIVDLVSPDNLTTDRAIGISVAVDMSGSMARPEIVSAVITGYNTMLNTLATTSERRQMFLQTVVYDNDVNELYAFQRLVSPKDNRTLNVPYLDGTSYDPARGGGTASIRALMKVAADNRLFQEVLGLDDIDVSSRHVLVLLTDGFVNDADPKDAEQLRRFVKRLTLSETWTFLMFGMADRTTAGDFAKYLKAQTRFKGTSEEAARIMFQAMATGWGYWVDDPKQIDQIADPAARELAKLLHAAEQIIVKHFDSSYKGIGGMGMPPNNVLTVWNDPAQIVDMIGGQVSQSIIQASQGKVSTTVTGAPTSGVSVF